MLKLFGKVIWGDSLFKRYNFLILLIVIAFALNVSCDFFAKAKEDRGENKTVEQSTDMQREIPVIVTAARIKRGELVRQIKTEGSLICRQVFMVNARVSGRIVGGVFKTGERVKKGQVVLKIDDRRYRLEKVKAESELSRAIATLVVEEENLKKVFTNNKPLLKELKRLDSMYSNGEIDFDTYLKKSIELRKKAIKNGSLRGSVVLNRTGVANAEFNLEQAKLNLEYCNIKSPFDGIIANNEAFKGREVNIGDRLMDILNTGSFFVKASIVEDELPYIKTGKNVEVRFEAFPGKIFKGRISEINPEVDEKTRTVSIFVKLNNAENLYPGLYASVYVDTVRIKNKLIVPLSAVLTREGRPLIFVIDKTNHTKWVFVKIIAKNDSFAAIENASDYTTIKEGDLVVASNNLTLGHGSLVEVKKVIE